MDNDVCKQLTHVAGLSCLCVDAIPEEKHDERPCSMHSSNVTDIVPALMLCL